MPPIVGRASACQSGNPFRGAAFQAAMPPSSGAFFPSFPALSTTTPPWHRTPRFLRALRVTAVNTKPPISFRPAQGAIVNNYARHNTYYLLGFTLSAGN